jgi:hypothetical protein
MMASTPSNEQNSPFDFKHRDHTLSPSELDTEQDLRKLIDEIDELGQDMTKIDLSPRDESFFDYSHNATTSPYSQHQQQQQQENLYNSSFEACTTNTHLTPHNFHSERTQAHHISEDSVKLDEDDLKDLDDYDKDFNSDEYTPTTSSKLQNTTPSKPFNYSPSHFSQEVSLFGSKHPSLSSFPKTSASTSGGNGLKTLEALNNAFSSHPSSEEIEYTSSQTSFPVNFLNMAGEMRHEKSIPDNTSSHYNQQMESTSLEDNQRKELDVMYEENRRLKIELQQVTKELGKHILEHNSVAFGINGTIRCYQV